MLARGVSVQQGQGAPGARPVLCQEHGTKPGAGTGRAAEAAALPHAHQLGGSVPRGILGEHHPHKIWGLGWKFEEMDDPVLDR